MALILPERFLGLPITPLAKRHITINLTLAGVANIDIASVVFFNNLFEKTPLIYFDFYKKKQASAVVAAAEIDGVRALLGNDYSAPNAVAIRSINIGQDLVLNIDLNDGAGGGGSTESTDLATAPVVIRVNKQPAVREVLAVEKRTDGTWRFAGSTLISKTGDLELQVTGGEVYAIGVDDFGIPYQAGLDLELGQTVRPTLFQGWLYECTEVGQLPGTEPTWWSEEGENPPRLVGTARLQAVRYYQPIAHGPIHYELI